MTLYAASVTDLFPISLNIEIKNVENEEKH